MSIKTHLIETHTNAGENCVKAGQFHKSMAKHFAGLSELAKGAKSEMHGDGADLATICQQISDEHDAMAGACADQAAFHVQCCKNLSAASKADGDEDLLDKLVPTEISAVIPTVPGIRAVPRAGQRDNGGMPVVAHELEKFVSIGDEGEF